MKAARNFRRFGDAAVQFSAPSTREAHGLAWAIEREQWAGVEEVVVGFQSVTVIADPTQLDLGELAARVALLAPADPDGLDARIIDIPVVFDGPDLGDVARLASTTTDGVIEAVCGAVLTVAMVGFVPGFAYLEGLPEQLAVIPRRPSPRARVEAGAVAVGGGYAGVYPVATPGGWQLLGRSSARLFDRSKPPFTLLRPGDRVRFSPVEQIEIEADPPRRPIRAPAGAATMTVLSPGTMSTVQDRGRVGFAALGVPRAGPADLMSARLANLAVGNPGAAAAVEMTLRGAALRVSSTRCVALVGDADLTVDGTRVAPGAVHLVGAGQVLAVGPIAPRPRAYLAVAGGLESPAVLSSRSSDLLCGIGPGPLVAGDELALGEPGRARGWFEMPERSTRLRVLRGPDVTSDDDWAMALDAELIVGDRSDRTGVRLVADPPLPPVDPVAGSVAMVTGAVQLLPGGDLIVLGVDHATLGGYPVVAAVVSSDLPLVGQLRPGDKVKLEEVDARRAMSLLAKREASLERFVRGWYPTVAG